MALAACGSDGRRIARTSPERTDGQPVEAVSASEPRSERARQAESAPAPAPTRATPAKTPYDESDAIDATIARAQVEYDNGLEAMRAGDMTRAREHFDRAVEIYVEAGSIVGDTPRLQESFEKLTADIAALEQDLDEPPASQDEEVPVVEQLDEIIPELTPEQIPVAPQVSESAFDIPLVINKQVQTCVNTFKNQPAFRKSFVGGYERYGWYQEMIHRILEEEGLPSDLIYVAFLESTYKPNAYSRARAKGIWQFMTPTGRMYGLKVDKYVDERSHPEKATRAAARYLKDLYAIFNDWTLAIAAYNTGAGNILRAQRRTGMTDYWDLARTRHMHRDTKGFVPCITALGLMSKDPEGYGFEGLQRFPSVTWDTVVVDGPTSIATIAKLSGSTEEEVRFLNPHLRRGVTPPGRKEYEVMVPPGSAERFRAAYTAMPASERIASVSQTHTVRRGETLASIAVRYGSTPQELAAANNIRNVHRISVGMHLEVPAQVGTSGAHLAAARPPETSAALRRSTHHTVRRGDTLSGIARSFGVSLRNLMNWNSLDQDSILRPGMRLAVKPPAATDALRHPQLPAPVPVAGLINIPGGGEAPPDQAGEKITYVVRRGDNLFRLAMKFRTTVEHLMSWNELPDESIKIGQRLVIYPG